MSRPTGGYVKLYRKVLNSWIGDDPIAFTMLCVLVMWANRKPGKAMLHRQLIHLERGQVATGRDELSKKLRCSKNKIDRLISRCEEDGILGSKRGNRGSVITILNYDKYQFAGEDDGATDGAADRAADGAATRAATGAHKETKRRETRRKPHSPLGDLKVEASGLVATLLTLNAAEREEAGRLRDKLGPRHWSVFTRRFPEGYDQFHDWWAGRQNQKSPSGAITAQLRDVFTAYLGDLASDNDIVDPGLQS